MKGILSRKPNTGNICSGEPRIRESDGDSQGEYDAHQDVHSVHDKVGDHRTDAVLHADEPAFEGHQTEGRWGCPYPYMEICGGQFAHLRSAVDHKEGRFEEYPLYGNQDKGTPQSYSEGAGKNSCTFLPVVSAEGLGSQTSCTHAKETEVPVEQVEEHGPDGDSADHCRRRNHLPGRHRPVQMAGHGDIHHSHQRDGYVRQNAGDCQFQYILIDWSHLYLPSSSSIPRYEE